MDTNNQHYDITDGEYIKEVINPIGDIILTTAERYSPNKLMDNTIAILKDTELANTIKPYQTVVAAGPYAEGRGIKKGDRVLINLSNYANTRFKEATLKGASTDKQEMDTVVKYYVPKLSINKVDHLRLGTSDIVAVVKTDYEFPRAVRKKMEDELKN